MAETRSILFSPSLMCADIFDLSNQIRLFEKYCAMLHVDIMDAHFAPNIALSMDYVKAVRKKTELPMDVHLMVERPNDILGSLFQAEPRFITVHAETIKNCAFRIVNRIKDAGIKVGIALCPATPVEEILAYLDIVDLVLVMTVDVGYAGQAFIPQMLKKIRRLHTLREERGLSFLIQADGCIGRPVYKQLYESGVDVFVLGTAGLFNRNSSSLEESFRTLKQDFYEETGVILPT